METLRLIIDYGAMVRHGVLCPVCLPPLLNAYLLFPNTEVCKQTETGNLEWGNEGRCGRGERQEESVQAQRTFLAKFK